jgi:hypothetical protein
MTQILPYYANPHRRLQRRRFKKFPQKKGWSKRLVEITTCCMAGVVGISYAIFAVWLSFVLGRALYWIVIGLWQ